MRLQMVALVLIYRVTRFSDVLLVNIVLCQGGMGGILLIVDVGSLNVV
jgi:hypothetical protein